MCALALLPGISAEPHRGVCTKAQLSNNMVSKAESLPNVNRVELLGFIPRKSLFLEGLVFYGGFWCSHGGLHMARADVIAESSPRKGQLEGLAPDQGANTRLRASSGKRFQRAPRPGGHYRWYINRMS